MCTLNEKTEVTKKVVHVMVTTLCGRNCKYCCNKQYSLDDVPYVTDTELSEADTVCLTGGEPFLFTNPGAIARFYKHKFPNIKKLYVYTNAKELSEYLKKYPNETELDGIDGLSVSIKIKADLTAFESVVKSDPRVLKLADNLLYIFNSLNPMELGNFNKIDRKWQKEFAAATDSIFRKA